MKKRSSEEIFIETLLALAKSQPVNKITVKRIVDESGLSTQTFYNHFEDKYDLIRRVHSDESLRLMHRLIEDEDYSYRDFIVDNLMFFMKNRDFMENALSNTSGYDSYAIYYSEQGYDVWSRYLVRKYGMEKLPEDIALYLKMYCRICILMMEEWISKMDHIKAEDYAEYIWQMTPVKLMPYFEKLKD